MIERRTIVVHTRLAGHMARVAAACAGACGTQIRTMDQLAARLAGGFLQPIDLEALYEAVRAALAATELGADQTPPRDGPRRGLAERPR